MVFLQKRDKRKGLTLIKPFFTVLVAGALLCSLAACIWGTGDENNGGTLSGIQRSLKAQDRPYNNIYTAKVGETLTNNFFAWTVTSVTTSNGPLTTSGGNALKPFHGDDHRFVLVDIEVKNISQKPIPAGRHDFFILYDYKGETYEEQAYSSFMSGMYPNEVSALDVGVSLAGKLVFEAPKGVSSVYVCYYEYLASGSSGSTYLFEVTLR